MGENIFCNEPGFCQHCGSILPLLPERGGVKCLLCKAEFGPEVFQQPDRKYIIYFNSKPTGTKKLNMNGTAESEGPVVERRCPKCDNDRMSYATLQLRSADEGQTVFYTCTKCQLKG
ncbi:RNA polymerase I subunit RpI12 isoform X2 [Lycorma delicatula]|uniref:RNA polymerase I subunit RpI12 isoform X2 n=1 Tax=Lycorma delicatula TaxID=130591 RepID=UPI003F5198E6